MHVCVCVCVAESVTALLWVVLALCVFSFTSLHKIRLEVLRVAVEHNVVKRLCLFWREPCVVSGDFCMCSVL